MGSCLFQATISATNSENGKIRIGVALLRDFFMDLVVIIPFLCYSRYLSKSKDEKRVGSSRSYALFLFPLSPLSLLFFFCQLWQTL